MTTHAELQTYLKQTGRYTGRVDNFFGSLEKAAILIMLTDGPDTALNDADFSASALRLGVPVRNIKAVTVVEAPGSGFQAGLPKILPERHRFSKLTKGRFDAKYPTISYPRWGTLPYPKSQDERYELLLNMIRLDIDAGFAAASYGRFQIMGENAKVCGYDTSYQFAEAMARDEPTQLRAFEAFVRGNGLLDELKNMSTTPESCAPFARGYNGTGYRENRYDEKLAAAVRAG